MIKFIKVCHHPHLNLLIFTRKVNLVFYIIRHRRIIPSNTPGIAQVYQGKKLLLSRVHIQLQPLLWCVPLKCSRSKAFKRKPQSTNDADNSFFSSGKPIQGVFLKCLTFTGGTYRYFLFQQIAPSAFGMQKT